MRGGDATGMAAAPAVSPAALPGSALPRRRPLAWATGRAGLVLLLTMFAVALLIRLPTLDQPLLEKHGFRQTQTAFTARLFHEEGVDLLHPKLPLLDRREEVPFEFPLFQAAAAGVMSFGVAPDTALRATSLFFFLLSALLVYLVARDLIGPKTALASTAVFLFSPFGFVWSRASLIEYLAVAASLGWFWAGIRWRHLRHRPYALLAAASGAVAMLVKPTTAAFWIIPLLVHETAPSAQGWRSWLVRRRDPVLAATIVVPLIAGLAWTRHADAIKAADPATAWLTSRALADWNFGTIEQRLTRQSWTAIGSRVSRLLVGLPFWLFAVALGFVFHTARRRWTLVAIAASAVGTVAVFFNLYVVHDYYLSAVSAQISILLGVAILGILRLSRPRRRKLMGALVVVWVGTFAFFSFDYWRPLFRQVADSDRVLPLSREIREHTSPDDRILFDSLDWSPAVPYYAERKGIMIPMTRTTEPVLAAVSADDFDVVATSAYSGSTAFLLAKWDWVTARSKHVFRMGSTLRSLGDAGVVAGTPAAAGWPADGAEPLLSSPVRIRCGRGGPGIFVGNRATWLRFDGFPQQRISLNGSSWSLPADRVVIVLPGTYPQGSTLAVDCVDPGSLRLMEAVDAPPPDAAS